MQPWELGLQKAAIKATAYDLLDAVGRLRGCVGGPPHVELMLDEMREKVDYILNGLDGRFEGQDAHRYEDRDRDDTVVINQRYTTTTGQVVVHPTFLPREFVQQKREFIRQGLAAASEHANMIILQEFTRWSIQLQAAAAGS